jgi:hypothetical protein
MILSCFKKGFFGLRPLTADTGTQTNLTISNAIDTLNITTFFDKTSSHDHLNRTDQSTIIDSISSPQHSRSNNNKLESSRMIEQEDTTILSNQMDSTIGHNNNDNLVLSEDSQNNNHFVTNNTTISTSSQLDLINSNVEDVKNKIDNIYINENIIRDVEMEEKLTPKEKELMQIIQIKDVRIKELEEQLNRKNDEIIALKSHLDKFQSVFSIGAMKHRAGVNRKRAQGISAEPQSQSELLNVNFPKYEKEEQ